MTARTSYAPAATGKSISRDLLLRLFEQVWLIRAVEQRTRDEYASRRIRGPVHLSIGQEGVAVGVLEGARTSDVCLSTHRNHAHYLAKGGSLAGMVDELYGLETGCSKGYGGSMHLFDQRANVLVSSAIVAGSVPIAAGVAFALRSGGTGDICICFTGDGGTDEGVFYETLNMAALFKLPVLFVVENNGLSTLTPHAKRQAVPDILAKAKSFGVDGVTVDGNDTLHLYQTCQGIMQRIRQTHAPFLLEAVTSRLCAHVGPTIYTSGIGADEELLTSLEREPLKVLRSRIQKEFPELGQECAKIERSVLDEVDRVFEDAKKRFDEEVKKIGLPPPPSPPDPCRV